MIVTITIDTEKQLVTPSADIPTAALAEYLLQSMPENLGRYYGLLARRLAPKEEAAISHNALRFSTAALHAFSEEGQCENDTDTTGRDETCC